MSSELIRRPSTSKMQARTGGKVVDMVDLCEVPNSEAYETFLCKSVQYLTHCEGTTGWKYPFKE